VERPGDRRAQLGYDPAGDEDQRLLPLRMSRNDRQLLRSTSRPLRAPPGRSSRAKWRRNGRRGSRRTPGWPRPPKRRGGISYMEWSTSPRTSSA
jgi:hypothetical protein